MIISSRLIKTFSSYLLLLALLTICAAILQAQSRPRRIGQDTKPPTSSGSTSTGSTTPSKPPVLGGANGTTGSRPSADPASNGPEEVEAGDVIKVNTTLVTLPVSVMDREGRYVPNLTEGRLPTLGRRESNRTSPFSPRSISPFLWC